MNYKLEKNQYIILKKGLYLCYVNEWGTDKNNYNYCIASRDPYQENVLEIWGKGTSSQEAFESATLNMFQGLKKSVSVEVIKDINIYEFIEGIKEETFHPSPEGVWEVEYGVKDKEELPSLGQSFHMSIILDEEGECWPMHC